MRLEHPFCVFESHFSDAFCDRITAIGEALQPMAASVVYDPENNLRDSTVAWIRNTPENAWVFKQLTDFVFETNCLYWGWRLSGLESVQYTRYGPGQYYTWHADQRRKPYDTESRWPGLIRKVTIAIALSDGDDFSGGEFCIEDLNSPPHLADKRLHVLSGARKRGTAVVFPASFYHRVNKVDTGLRRSLGAWFVGPPYV